MQIVSNIALVSINETLLIQLISFLIFLFIINRIMFKPLRRTINDRDRNLQKLKEDIEGAEAEFQRLTVQIREQESEVRQEAMAVKTAIEEEGAREARKLFSAAREEIDRQRADADAEVARQIAEAKIHFEKEARRLAGRIMEKVLDRRLAT